MLFIFFFFFFSSRRRHTRLTCDWSSDVCSSDLGCQVVGIAGTKEKCSWVVDELGFDACIDYRTENVVDALRKACPNGIDVYFDNVGGDILDAALQTMNDFGRIV